MKKLALLIVVLVALWLGVNFVRTGQLAFLPTSLSAEEQHVQNLEGELKNVDDQISQAARTAGITGMDTTGDVSALMVKRDKLQKELVEARKQLH